MRGDLKMSLKWFSEYVGYDRNENTIYVPGNREFGTGFSNGKPIELNPSKVEIYESKIDIDTRIKEKVAKVVNNKSIYKISQGKSVITPQDLNEIYNFQYVKEYTDNEEVPKIVTHSEASLDELFKKLGRKVAENGTISNTMDIIQNGILVSRSLNFYGDLEDSYKSDESAEKRVVDTMAFSLLYFTKIAPLINKTSELENKVLNKYFPTVLFEDLLNFGEEYLKFVEKFNQPESHADKFAKECIKTIEEIKSEGDVAILPFSAYFIKKYAEEKVL